MQQASLEFAIEMTNEERLLDGRRIVSIEGVSADEAGRWSLAFGFGQPEPPNPGVDEGELTLLGPEGDLFAVLEGGRIDRNVDEDTVEELEQLDIFFRIAGGERDFEQAQGYIRIQGALRGDEGSLSMIIDLTGANDQQNEEG